MLSPRDYYHQDLKKTYKLLCAWGKIKILKRPIQPTDQYDYLVLENVLGDIPDVQNYLYKLKLNLKGDSRLLIVYYNHLWEPILRLASFIGWRQATPLQNWLSTHDTQNLLELSGYDVVSTFNRCLLPLDMPVLTFLINKYLAHLPLVNQLCLINIIIARKKPSKPISPSVSVIIPARNESGNIARAIKTLPVLSPKQELIFIEGHSKDDTWQRIQKEIKRHPRPFPVHAYRQVGEGKADAVRLGFAKAKYQLLMILDADLTVDPSELSKFYQAISSGQAEYVHGSRLVYPMEQEAMRLLNKLGNKFFGLVFTLILGQRIKDTLCGTKVLLKKHYDILASKRTFFGEFDPFGDFDLIFGVVRMGLKLKEIPIKYKERTYGRTNISRFRHGLLLLKMTAFAFHKFKAY